MDPELRELLQESADRSVAAVDTLRGDIAELRRVVDRDREAEGHRQDRIEARLERYGAVIHELDERFDALGEKVDCIERRSAVLVTEEDGPGGETVVTAKPARIGLDWKTVLAAISGFSAAVVVPIVVAVIST